MGASSLEVSLPGVGGGEGVPAGVVEAACCSAGGCAGGAVVVSSLSGASKVPTTLLVEGLGDTQASRGRKLHSSVLSDSGSELD